MWATFGPMVLTDLEDSGSGDGQQALEKQVCTI